MVEAALGGGVDTVLLREPELDSARLLAMASRLRLLTARHRARLLIHTQADVAAAVSADGIHVSAGHIGEIPLMREWLGDVRVSYSASCHDLDELRRASAVGADFALLSPLFATASHPRATPLGVRRFRNMAAQVGLPVVALGGITPVNRAKVAAYPVAVISSILDASNPAAVARSLRMA